MSFLRRGNRRGRRSAALVVAGALFAFQALAIVGATSAFALSSCTFSGGTLAMIQGAGETTTLSVNETGDILINGADSTVNADCLTATRATLTNTTAITVTGFNGDETLNIVMYDPSGDLVNWGAINWTINLASSTSDTLVIDGSGLTVDDDLDLAAGASGIDLNNDGDLDATVSGVELAFVFGGLGDDTIWLSGSTATGAAFTVNTQAFGFGGDDTIASGAGDDTLNGGGDDDTVDFSGATAGVNVNLAGGVATGMGSDVLAGFVNVVGSGFNDSITGADGVSEIITPGAGDDTLAGGTGAVIDYVDYSDATAAVTVDLTANTATGGSGNDSLGGIEGAFGSDFADTFVDQIDQDNEYFGGGGNDIFGQGADPSTGDADIVDGEGGIDTVDYGLRTESLTVDLGKAVDPLGTAGSCTDASEFTSGDVGDGEGDCLAGLENAILGTGDDTFTGNAFANRVWPNGGQNVLNGDAVAGPFTGGDVLDYSVGYEAGVNVNMAGGATAGDSAIGFENAIGTAFNDKFVGDGQSNTIRGAGGNDGIRSGGGDDTVRGGAGNDRLRTGSGDDDAFGGAGNDRINGGSGVDFCKGGPGNDRVRGCEQGRA